MRYFQLIIEDAVGREMLSTKDIERAINRGLGIDARIFDFEEISNPND